MGETSTKPYLIRALHEWCTDNGYTPYITVQVDEHTMVPVAHVRDGQITLNVGTLATNKLSLGNEFIEFQARFSGVTENVYVPVGAVSAIYARETGAGMGFEVQAYEAPEHADAAPAARVGRGRRCRRLAGWRRWRRRRTQAAASDHRQVACPKDCGAKFHYNAVPRKRPCAACVHAGVAQLVEQLTCNEKVEGSIPFTGTSQINDLGRFLWRRLFRLCSLGVIVPEIRPSKLLMAARMWSPFWWA